MHIEYADELVVGIRIAAQVYQGVGHRQVEHLRQLGQRRGGTVHDHAAAGIHDRMLGG